MPMLVAGLLLLWLSSILLRGFVRANPAALARFLRRSGGWVALGFALFMLVRGELNVAIAAAGLGAWLLTGGRNLNPFSAAAWQAAAPRWRPRAGVSRIASPTLEMMLDRASGQVQGRCLTGPFAGRQLSDLSRAECVQLHGWCSQADFLGARLLESYFDRRFPGWREAAHAGADAGGTQAGFRQSGPTRMSDREAYQVLGLQDGASREEIARAHRRLMKKHHPDYGGSTDMAALVNEAKDVLMRRHP